MSLPGDTSDQPIKRAPVVYGKRSSDKPVDPADEQEHAYRVGCAPTVTSRRRRSTPSFHASDSERSHGADTADPFQFDFRHRLKKLDEQFDDYDTQSSKPGSLRDNNQEKDPQSVSMGTGILSPEVHHSSRDHSHVSSSTLFCPAAAGGDPPESPPAHRHTSIVPCLSDGEELSASSSGSPVQHAITTPHSRLSPTPPTSSEVPMASKKAKGKAPVRDVLPLLFGGEHPPSADIPIKSKRRGQSDPLVRTKTKAPTKKERREAAFESSRIAASRPVELIRVQEQKHTLSTFFAGLRRDNGLTPTLGTELLSDPIERFSSPTDNSVHAQPSKSMFGIPREFFRTSAHAGPTDQQLPSGNTENSASAATDSDDEMPSIVSIIRQASGKQHKLQAIKRVALQHPSPSKAVDSEDDDLLVVKDDMHSIAHEEAAQRRLDRTHGSPAKDRTLYHPNVRHATISPARKLSKQELQEFAKPSFAFTRKGNKGRLSKTQLDQMMMTQHTEEQLESIKLQEEEWVKRGGKLLRDARMEISLSQRLEAYARQGLKAVEMGNAAWDEASDGESDKEYIPEVQGSPSPKSVEEGDVSGDDTELSHVPRPPGRDDSDEEVIIRSKRGQRRLRPVVESDDEGKQYSVPAMPRDLISSMGSQTEDENDKENGSEDKENKAVARHKSSSLDMAIGSSLSSLHGIQDNAQRNLSAINFSDTSVSQGDIRSPLKDISKDKDDFFLSPPSKSPSTNRLLQSAAISSPRSFASTFNLGSSPLLQNERIGRIDQPSLGSETEEKDLHLFKTLKPSFLERLHSQADPEPSLVALNPLSNGGFSQLFSAEDQNQRKSINEVENISLTLDIGLKPALEVSSTLRQKADIIFEKEQEYVVAAAVQQNDQPKELLYVNDHGFLTQTRPEGSSPRIYRTTPSPASNFIGTRAFPTQTQLLSARLPLCTLAFTTSQELPPEPQPLRRLRKRSLSPLEHKDLERRDDSVTRRDVFGDHRKAPKPPPKTSDKKHEKSEFVAVEAEESDDDDMFGFGGPKKDDDNDDEDNEHVIEGLVDDTFMDVDTEAADLVQEKYREHEEEDDQRLQKLHQDAIEGKFRTKRRDRGVGFEDDSDDNGEEEERRIRQRIHKKRKIEGDNLEALGQNKETRAFYNTYHQDLIDEDDELKYLRDGSTLPDDGNPQGQESEERETVSMDEIRHRVREIAQNNYEVEVLDPEDTSWVDQSMATEPDDTVRVKIMDYQRCNTSIDRRNAGPIDFGVERSVRTSEQERKQMSSWAKGQSHQYQGTGRSGNTAAVTGHAKAKSGGGSLRSVQVSNPAAVDVARRAKTSSLLSTVSDRSGKFA